MQSIPRKDTLGYLHLYIGPMFSGKTSRLIQELSRYADIGYSTLFINSKMDTRGEEVSTHSSQFRCLSPRVSRVKTELLSSVDASSFIVVGIDEAQFYGLRQSPDSNDLTDTVKRWVMEGKIVLISGLDGDSRQKRFGHILDLIPFADSVEKMMARCVECLRRGYLVDAPFTQRLSSTEAQVEVGAGDIYRPVCRRCFNSV